MKRVYWRPSKVSRTVLVFVALTALGGTVAVELLPVRVKQAYYTEKIAAARLSLRAFDMVRSVRESAGHQADPEVDPTGVGLIGVPISQVTTNTGHLPAKQTTINPNWAAVIVHLLKRAGVEEGDAVAVGCSGSFPALNVSTYAAMQTLKVLPVVIVSVGASQWGANEEGFSWLDMEKELYDRKIFDFRAVAASLGGIEDKALGLTKAGRASLRDTIARSGVAQIDATSYQDSLEQRMQIYDERTGERRIAAYINIGGGTSSVGTKVGKRLFRPGLNRSAPVGAVAIDSAMTRFAREGVPVIHLIQIDQLAQRYGLPLQPKHLAKAGEGKVFVRFEYNDWLAAGVLLFVLLALYGLVRSDWAVRFLQVNRRIRGRNDRAERMV